MAGADVVVPDLQRRNRIDLGGSIEQEDMLGEMGPCPRCPFPDGDPAAAGDRSLPLRDSFDRDVPAASLRTPQKAPLPYCPGYGLLYSGTCGLPTCEGQCCVCTLLK